MTVPLGAVAHLQVQREKIKSGNKPHERYTPQGILTRVDALVLATGGVTGLLDGEEIVDVHSEMHPRSRFRGINGISFLTTGHYAKMRARFGDHLADGIAAESLLVDSDRILTLDDLARGIAIGGGNDPIVIHEWSVAHPCIPFSRFATRFPDDAKPDRRITEALRFLDDGTRGFYGVLPETYAGRVIRVGDIVSLLG
ncbi:MAG TPA: hypothetical protein VNZ58_05215 [Thermomicrobiales bacterium]|nr:hypothetical protein [Thermomicrobiales bacterium]